MHAEPHARTSSHYQILYPTPLFSKNRLKRKDFQELARLPWAQEASGSNPDAPTKHFKYLAERFISLPVPIFVPTACSLEASIKPLIDAEALQIRSGQARQDIGLLASTGLKQDSKIEFVRLRRGHPRRLNPFADI